MKISKLFSWLSSFLIVIFPPLVLAQTPPETPDTVPFHTVGDINTPIDSIVEYRRIVPPPVDSSVSPRDPKIAFETLADLYGVTFCVGEHPTYFVNGEIDGWALQATRAHEEKHIEQYHRFKTCAAFDWYYHSPIGKLETETEAYVAGWCAVYDDVDDPLAFEAASVHNVARMGFDVFEVVQVWKKYQSILCPSRPQPSNEVP